MEQKQKNNVSKTIKDFFGNMMNALLSLVINALDWIMDPIQRKIGMKRMAYVFLLPNMVIFGIFVLFPMLVNIYYSFTGGTNLFPQDRPFVGLDNFRVLFTCDNFLDPNTCTEDLFWRAVYNTIKFVIFQVVGIVLFSLITALILNRKIVARGFFRSVYFYPVLLSPVVVALIWKWILQRDGLLNALIIGMGGERINFLLNSDWATFWVIFISIWANMGFFTLILLAGLQSIPPDLYEAGSMDGTNEWQSFQHITLPLLMPTMLVVLVLSLIRAVQVFDQVYVLTGGGPGSATLYMVQYIYNKGFSDQIHIFGLAAAASVIMAAVLMVFTLLQLYLSRKSDAV
ncbi:MAG: sugar ABC transporter permease [Anaerolineaceae bacterium]|nr:sugar ABC transporter permease [Anaerolineaceae bacterium]